MNNKLRRSEEYRQNGCFLEKHDELLEGLYGGEWIAVFYVKHTYKMPFFLAEVGDIYAESIDKEDTIKALKMKLHS